MCSYDATAWMYVVVVSVLLVLGVVHSARLFAQLLLRQPSAGTLKLMPRVSRRLFVSRVASGLLGAIAVTYMLDAWVHVSGGFSFFLHPCDFPDQGELTTRLVSLRDGLAASTLFFLAAGVSAASAGVARPEDESITARVQMLFPRLSEYGNLVVPFSELAKESSAVAEVIRLSLRVSEYNEKLGAFKLHVKRREVFVNLLECENYHSPNFEVEVGSDKVADEAGVAGCVRAAKFLQLDKYGRRAGKSNHLGMDDVQLTLSSPNWKSASRALDLPAGGKGVWTLEYWYWAKTSVEYVSTARRPVQSVFLTISNGTQGGLHCEVEVDGRRACSENIKANDMLSPKVVIESTKPKIAIRLSVLQGSSSSFPQATVLGHPAPDPSAAQSALSTGSPPPTTS